MKIVVTGATGQLGCELRDILQQNAAYECFFLGRKELPLDQTELIQDILGIYQPDIIIHTGAYTAVDLAEREPESADRVNHLASAEVAQYCHFHDCRLIALSTDYVFDGNAATPLKEDTSVSPVNTYGETKLKGEQAILKWYPQAVIIRTSWVYSKYGKNFVKTMLGLMWDRDHISVVNDQIGSPTYAKDLAQAIMHIVHTDQWKPGIYHYSNEGQVSWYDFAVAIRDIKGLTCTIEPISTEQYPTPARRPKYALLDKTKIKDTFGLEVPFWRDSLAAMLKDIACKD